LFIVFYNASTATTGKAAARKANDIEKIINVYTKADPQFQQ
jgi:hypothetical protein